MASSWLGYLTAQAVRGRGPLLMRSRAPSSHSPLSRRAVGDWRGRRQQLDYRHFSSSAEGDSTASSTPILARQVQPKDTRELDAWLTELPASNIRNFSIIAHVDHGKSTLTDRILELTSTIKDTGSNAQVLDKLQVERERGITVKAQSCSLFYHHKGERYLLNLVDTPGHVDFSYEVSRSLLACEGAALLVDAAQGVQAQTVANFYLAFEQGLTIVPVINKIDLPNADVERTAKELNKEFDFDREECLPVSAKSGVGVGPLLDAIVERIPPPECRRDAPLKVLIFDSWYDDYLGVVSLVYVVDGVLEPGMQVTSHHSKATHPVKTVGIMHPERVVTSQLYAGQVGYMTAAMKTTKEALIGDTLYAQGDEVAPLPGFKPPKNMVFSGLYPVDSGDYTRLAAALEKLTLNDASVTLDKETSVALGSGFRAGFLGLLHMEVFHSRLDQEYGTPVIATVPTVPVLLIDEKSGEVTTCDNPSKFPQPVPRGIRCQEPVVKATVITPQDYLGKVMELVQARRGSQDHMQYLEGRRCELRFTIPLSEIIIDFFDELKNMTSGYATFDYDFAGHADSDLAKVDIVVNDKPVDALALIASKGNLVSIARRVVNTLSESIPRQQYEVRIQACTGSTVHASARIRPFRKDVTAKCYGGDVTRRNKLLDKQKKGKARMRQIGNIDIPQQAFLDVLGSKKGSGGGGGKAHGKRKQKG